MPHQNLEAPDSEAMPKRTVFVVDDSDSVRIVTMRALETFGYATLAASDGFEAVQSFREHHDNIDCLILDMSMPGMNGEQTLQSLREIDDSVPVLLASGHSIDEMRESYGHAGFAGYLQKPFHVAELANVVNQAINSRAHA